MSSLTKVQFIVELKVRSSVLSSMDDSALGTFIDIALRAVSKRLPELRVSVDNAVVSGQESYDFPASALGVVAIRNSETKSEVLFAIENEGSGDKIKLGSVMSRSYQELMQQDYYENPLAQDSWSQESYSAFDIVYTMIQDMDSIKDTSLEALSFYVEHLALLRKAEESADQASGAPLPVSITDSSSDGSATTVSFGDTPKRYRELSTQALERFEDEVTQSPYGTRG